MSLAKDVNDANSSRSPPAGGSLNGLTDAGPYQQPDNRDCNPYAHKIEQGLILLDCGNGETLPQIWRRLETWGFSAEDVRACLFTHAHWDHADASTCRLSAARPSAPMRKQQKHCRQRMSAARAICTIKPSSPARPAIA